MKALVTLLFIVALVVPTVGQQPADPSKDATYFPVKKGTTWTYKAGPDTVVVVVKDSKKEGTDDVHELETSVAGTPVANEHVVVKMDGVYRVKVGGVKVEPPLKFLQFPIKKGESWNVDSKIGTETLKGKFTLGEEEATVPQGKHKAVTVAGPDMLANGQKMSLSYSFAEKVGMVKQTADLGGVRVILELVKFEEGK